MYSNVGLHDVPPSLYVYVRYIWRITNSCYIQIYKGRTISIKQDITQTKKKCTNTYTQTQLKGLIAVVFSTSVQVAPKIRRNCSV